MKRTIITSLLAAATLISHAQKNAGDFFLLIGTYTGGKSEGIYVYSFDSKSGEYKHVSTAKNITNPSYLAVSANEKYVYAVNENGNKNNSGGNVTSYSFDKSSGSLKELNTQPSGGDHPCYVAVDKTGKFVAVGNYSSGTVNTYPVNKDGSLNAASAHIQHEGSGVNSDRQEGPHVHATVFSKDNNYLFVPDLGLDKVMIYSFNDKSGALTPAAVPHVETEPGTGPRHIDFSPNSKYAYLIEELTGSISAYRYKSGQLELIQNISSLSPEFNGEIGSADIHVSPDGRFLYASNRGQSNDIGIFSINQQTGELTYIASQPTLGKTPRNFNIDPSGNFLLAANQNSDEIVIFKRDKQTGLLTVSGKKIEVGKPVCIKWISK